MLNNASLASQKEIALVKSVALIITNKSRWDIISIRRVLES